MMETEGKLVMGIYAIRSYSLNEIHLMNLDYKLRHRLPGNQGKKGKCTVKASHCP